MTPWKVMRLPDGSVILAELPPLITHYLLELPEWIDEHPDEAARKRLYPSPDPNDPEKTAEWERLMVPELFALVASARAIIELDLVLLAQTAGLPGHARVQIPSQHMDAWIQGLQVARLSMAAENTLIEGDLDDWPEPEMEPDKAEAVVCVSILGEIQALLIELGSGISSGLPASQGDPSADPNADGETAEAEFGGELLDTFEAFLGRDLLDEDFDDDTHEADPASDDHE